MSDQHEPGRLGATADALIALADLLETHRVNSPEVKDFLEKHQDLPEFRDLAEEALRLQTAFAETSAVGVADTAAPVRVSRLRQTLSYVAGFAGVMVFLLIGISAVGFAVRTQSLETAFTQTNAQFDQTKVQLVTTKGENDVLATKNTGLMNENLAQLRNHKAALAQQKREFHAKQENEERQFMKAVVQFSNVLQKGESDMPTIKSELKAGRTYMVRGFRDKIPQLKEWGLQDPDKEVSQGAALMLYAICDPDKTTEDSMAWQALRTISNEAKEDDMQKTAKQLLNNLPALTPEMKKNGAIIPK